MVRGRDCSIRRALVDGQHGFGECRCCESRRVKSRGHCCRWRPCHSDPDEIDSFDSDRSRVNQRSDRVWRGGKSRAAGPQRDWVFAHRVLDLRKDAGDIEEACSGHFPGRHDVCRARRVWPCSSTRINPNAEVTMRNAQAGALTMGLQIQVLSATTSGELDAAFALVRRRSDALLVAGDAFFLSRRVQLAGLALRHAMPAIYSLRDFTDVGGLMNYGVHIAEAYRQVGIYTGRILKGDKPEELPVVQSTRFELVINAQTARTLGLDIPDKLLARADEVIE